MTDSGDRITQDTLIDSLPEPNDGRTYDELQVEVDRKVARLRSVVHEFEDVAVSVHTFAGLRGVERVLDRAIDAFNEF